jgi:hypothetical protein
MVWVYLKVAWVSTCFNLYMKFKGVLLGKQRVQWVPITNRLASRIMKSGASMLQQNWEPFGHTLQPSPCNLNVTLPSCHRAYIAPWNQYAPFTCSPVYRYPCRANNSSHHEEAAKAARDESQHHQPESRTARGCRGLMFRSYSLKCAISWDKFWLVFTYSDILYYHLGI